MVDKHVGDCSLSRPEGFEQERGLLSFVLLALGSRRFWPLWVAGFQLTSVLSHFLKTLHWDMIPQVYAAAERFWIYPIFLAIVVGTWRNHKRWLRDREFTATHA